MTEKIYKKLPEVLQTSAVKNFFESTVEQLFSKANTEQLQGFIGYKTKEDAGVKGAFISEPTATRRFYSVSPVANNINPQTNQSENIVFYDEFIDTLATYGVDVRNQNKLFGEKFSTFMPPVDVDKLINYQEYYWYPDGPSTINISGTLAKPIDIDRDILGRVSYTSPNNKKFRNGMIIKFDGQYVIPSSEVGVEYIVEGVGEGIYLVPKSDNFSTRFSTPVNDLFDPAIINLDDPNVTHSAGNVSSVTILNGGTGYSNSDILVFSGTANTQATGNIIVDGNGSVTSIVITSSGNHYSDHVSATISSATGSGFVGGVVLDEMHEFLNADFVGSISGNVLTVSSVTSGALAANMYLIGTGIDAGTYIVSGAGTTWYLNQSLTATGSITITGNTVNILDTQIKFGVNPNTGKYYLTGDTVNGFDGEASTWGGGLSQSAADYILIRRGAANKNIWSRVNFWYHRDNFKDAGDELPSSAYRAARPIIEFDHRIELYNHGVNGIGGVNIASTNLSYADVNGSRTGLLIDDVPSERALIVFPTEPASVAKYIYQAITNTATNLIELKRVGDPVLNPTGAVDGDADFVPWEMTVGDVVQIKNGNLNTGKEYRYTSNGLVLCQEKLTINQDPLFNLYDDTGVALDDPGKYPNATFTGNAIFGYMRNIDELYNVTELNAKQSPVEDSVLGFKLYYKGFKASSEIAFKNHLGIEHHYYVPLGQVGQEFIPGYYFYKLTNNSVDEFHYDWKTVSKPSQQKIYTSYTLSQFDIDRGSVTFFIGCEPRFNVDVNSSYEITVTVNGIKREDFTYGESRVGFIDFDTFNFSVGDFIEICAASDTGLISYDSISKYEIPVSWRNPYVNGISVTAEPEYLQHYKNYMEAQVGFQGDALSINNFSNTTKDINLAKDIISSDDNAILAAFLLDDQPHNLVNAIRFNSSEYVKYKNRLKSEIENYFNTYDISTYSNEYVIEQVLRNVISYKVGKDVFNRTYVVPFGDNYTNEEFIINDRTTVEFVSAENVDLDNIENSLLVYQRRDANSTNKLLNVDIDYTITSFNPLTIEITNNVSLDLGDVVVMKIYGAERDSAQCPATPSILGLYQLYQPGIEVDNTFSTPVTVIIGHDGSRTPAWGDRRDEILLEFEKRIYNAAKSEFRLANSLPALNKTAVKPGAFRTTGFEYYEWYDLLRYHYSTWVSSNKLDPIENQYFDTTDSWTWNYRGDSSIPGYWKGWYNFYYDTIRPNTHPWEMLGFTEQPLWWEDEYGTNYSSTNTAMWSDLADGIIRQGTRENLTNDKYLVDNPFRRVGLHEVVPVDSNGDLISPYNLISTGTTTKTKEWRNTTVNDSLAYKTTSILVNDGINVSYDSSNVYLQGRALVNHTINVERNFVGHSVLEEQDVSYAWPRNYTPTATKTSLPDYAVGVLINGLPLYNTATVETWNNEGEWKYNKVAIETHSDLTLGHVSGNGLMHYYTVDPKVVELEQWDKTVHSPIVGWAFDGLPIYGPYGYREYFANGAVKDNTITNIKSAFKLRSGIRLTGPGGAHTGTFVQDYDYNPLVDGKPGYVGQVDATGAGVAGVGLYNVRYGRTPDSPNSPIYFYVATLDDAGKPMFPYAVGGGVQNHSTSGTVWGSKYFAVPLDLANNTQSSAVVPSGITEAITSDSIVSKSYNDEISMDWKFGDGAPVEMAWKYSEEYPFAVTEALLLSKPAKFATLFADPTQLTTTTVNPDVQIQKVTRKSWDYANREHFRVHGDTNLIDGSFVTNIGYTQFINSWLAFQGLTVPNSFSYKLRTLNIKLGHRMAGFIDKDTMVLRTDQYSTTGNATSLIIPQENIGVQVHSSPYKTRNFYSGVIIEKSEHPAMHGHGYKVRGFDKNFGYFLTLESDTRGPRERVSVGGEPAKFVDWSPNIFYKRTTIVRYQNGYYSATDDVQPSTAFERNKWTRLSALPQVGAATGVLYQETTGNVVRVDYETLFSSTDEVFDFLVALGRYQKSIGFTFGEFDSTINAVRDWNYAAKQFLFWVTGEWEMGNTLELSPMAPRVVFEVDSGFISKLNRVDRDQFVLQDQDGAVISPTECEIVREDNRIEIAPPAGKQIYSAVLHTQEIEHVLTVDNKTIFNDVIFDPGINQRHTRFKIKAQRTANWDGRYVSEGFIISGSELKPNLDNMAGSISRYNELGFIPVDKRLYQVSRAQFGHQEKEYLRELDILDDQQVDFYLGMLQSKGTTTSLGRITRSNAIVQGNVTVYDEWALRVADFGDVENFQSIELKVNKSEIKNDPQLVTLSFPEDTTNIVDKIEVLERKHRYQLPPQIIVSAPERSTGVRATAEATLNSVGELDTITVTNSGSGYADFVGITVIAGNVVVDTVETKFNYVTALSSGSWISTTGLSNIVINDHLSANGNVNVNLSSATNADSIVSLINNAAGLGGNITAAVYRSDTDADADGNVDVKYTLALSGKDFTIVSAASGLHLTPGRYQPRQRYAIATANNTVQANISVKVDGASVASSNWDFDKGDRWRIATVSKGDKNSSVVVNLNTGIDDNSTSLQSENVILIDGQYPFVDVYVNGTKIVNRPEQRLFTLTSGSVTFSNISLLPRSVLTPELDTDTTQPSTKFVLPAGSNVFVVEKPTIDFTDAYHGDVPGSTLNITVETNDAIAIKLGTKRIYEITPDAADDDVILIDIDDTSRFLKKPIGVREHNLWPTTSEVDYSGIVDSKYITIPNSGYVNPANVNYMSYDIASIPDLFDENIIIKPSGNSYIHVAVAENNDWNVYKLHQAGGTTYVANQGNEAKLFTTQSLFSYIDSNQIGENDTSRYLDYFLTLKNANVSSNVVIWTNETVVKQTELNILDVEAPRMIEARIKSIGPHPDALVAINNIKPMATVSYKNASMSANNANNIVTISNVVLPSLADGDVISINDSSGTIYGNNANIVFNSIGNITVNSANIANVAYVIAAGHVTLLTSSDATANNKPYYVESVNIAGGSFTITNSYFANANVVAGLGNVQFSVTKFEDFGNSDVYYQVSNVTPNSFTIERANTTAKSVDVYHMTMSKVFTSADHGLSLQDVVKVVTPKFSGVYNVRSVESSNSFVIAAPFIKSATYTGNVVKRGIQITTISNHGIDPIYARKKKRIAVHFSDPRDYNKTYFVDSVTPNKINVLGKYPVDDTVYYFYDEQVAYANADANVITVDSTMNLNDVHVMYLANSMMVPKYMYTPEANGSIVINNSILNANANVSTGFIIIREPENVSNGRYPVLTTLDHNKVKLNNSEIQIDSFNNLSGLATSINRAINLRRSAIVAEGDQRVFKMGFNFLKDPKTPVHVKDGSTVKLPAGAINNYGPYVKDSQVINTQLGGGNISVVGKLPLSNNIEKIVDKDFNKGILSKGPTLGFTYERDGFVYVWNPMLEKYQEYKILETENSPNAITGAALNGGTSDGTDADSLSIADAPAEATGSIDPTPTPAAHDPTKPKLRVIPGSAAANPAVTTDVGKKWRYYTMANADGTANTVSFTGVPGMGGTVTRPRWRLKPNTDFIYEVYEIVQNSAGNIYYILVDKVFPPATPHNFFGTVNAYNDFYGHVLETLYYNSGIAYDPTHKDSLSASTSGYTITIPPVEPAWYIGKQLIPEPFARTDGNGSTAIINFENLPQPLMIGTTGLGTAETKIAVNGTGMNSFLMWTPGLTAGEWQPTSQGPGSLMGGSGSPTYWGYGTGYYAENDGHRPTSSRSPTSTKGPYPGTSTNGWSTRQPRFKYSKDFDVYPILDTGKDDINARLVPTAKITDPANTGLRPEEIFVACFWTEAHTYKNQLVAYDYKNVDSNGNPTPVYKDYDGTVTRVKYIRLTELPFDAVLRRPIPDTGWGGKGWKNVAADGIKLPGEYDPKLGDPNNPWVSFDPTTPSSGGSTGDDTETNTGTGNVPTTRTLGSAGIGPGLGKGFDPNNVPVTDDVPVVNGQNNDPPGPVIHGGALEGLPTACEIDASNIPVPEIDTGLPNVPCFMRDKEDVIGLIIEKDKTALSTSTAQVNDQHIFRIVGDEPFRVFFDFSAPGTLANGISIEQADDEAFTKNKKLILDTSSTGTNKNIDDGSQIGRYGIDLVPGFGRTFVPDVDEVWYTDSAQVYANPLVKDSATAALAVGTNNNLVGVKGYGFIQRRIDCRQGEYVRLTIHKGVGNTVGTYRLAVMFSKLYERKIEPPPLPGCENATRGSRRFKDGAMLDKYVFSDAKTKNNKFLGLSFGGLFGKKSPGKGDGYFGNGASGPIRNQGDNIYYPYQAHPTYKNQSGYSAKTADPNSSTANGGLQESTSATVVNIGSMEEYCTYEFKGYYKASATGTHTFKTTSDDASWVWVSDVDDTLPTQEKYKNDGHRPTDNRNYNWNNATVANGGLHPPASAQGTVTLEAGKFYFVRGIFGNNKKGGQFSLEVQPPGTSSFTPVEFSGRLCPGDPGYVDPTATPPVTTPTDPGTTPGTTPGTAPGGGDNINLPDTPFFPGFITDGTYGAVYGVAANSTGVLSTEVVAGAGLSTVVEGRLINVNTGLPEQFTTATAEDIARAQTNLSTMNAATAAQVSNQNSLINAGRVLLMDELSSQVNGIVGSYFSGLSSLVDGNFSGYSKPSMTGYNFIPTAFKASNINQRIVAPQKYGFSIPLSSDRYVNATNQRVTGGFVIPLAKKLDIVSRSSQPLNSVNIQNEPWFKSVATSVDKTMRGVIYQPTKVSSTYYMPDGVTNIRNVTSTASKAGRNGYSATNNRRVIDRVQGSNYSETMLGGSIPAIPGMDTVTIEEPLNGIDFVPGVGVPPGGGGAGGGGTGGNPVDYDKLGPAVSVPWEELPVDTDNIEFPTVPTINITPLMLDNTGAYTKAGNPATAVITKPTPSVTISDDDLIGVKDNSEILINDKKIIKRPGSSIKDIAAQINCANMGVKALIDKATNQLKINSCTDKGFAVKNGCAGGRYKQVADFHVVRGFEQQRNISNTVTTTDMATFIPGNYDANSEVYIEQTFSRYYKNSANDIINANDDIFVGSETSAGAFLPSENRSNTTLTTYATGGSGYRIGDRLRLLGGTPVDSTIGPLTTVCIDYPGVGYNNPANLKVIIGDGSTPGVGASAIVTELDENGGVKTIQMLNYGIGYDISEPPTVTIVDTSDANQTFTTLDATNPSGTYAKNTIIMAQIAREKPGGLIELDEKFFRVQANSVTLGTVVTYANATLTFNNAGSITIGNINVGNITQPGYITMLSSNTSVPVHNRSFLVTSINTTNNTIVVSDAYFANANVITSANIGSISVSVKTPFTSRGMVPIVDPRVRKVPATLSGKVALSPDFVKAGNPGDPVKTAFVEGYSSMAGPVRVAKFIVTGVNATGAITSLKIIDRGLYKVFPADLTMGIPLEYDFEYLGNSPLPDNILGYADPIRDNKQYGPGHPIYSGAPFENGKHPDWSGFKEYRFNAKTRTFDEYSGSPGGYDPLTYVEINGKRLSKQYAVDTNPLSVDYGEYVDPLTLGGGTGARVFVTSQDVPDCSEKSTAREDLGLPEQVNEVNVPDALATMLNNALTGAGYKPEDIRFEVEPLGPGIGRLNLVAPSYPGVNIDTNNPGFLDKLGIPVGDYNTGMLCIQATISTPNPSEAEIEKVVSELYKTGKFGALTLEQQAEMIGSDGKVNIPQILSLLCVNTIEQWGWPGTPGKVVDGTKLKSAKPPKSDVKTYKTPTLVDPLNGIPGSLVEDTAKDLDFVDLTGALENNTSDLVPDDGKFSEGGSGDIGNLMFTGEVYRYDLQTIFGGPVTLNNAAKQYNNTYVFQSQRFANVTPLITYTGNTPTVDLTDFPKVWIDDYEGAGWAFLDNANLTPVRRQEPLVDVEYIRNSLVYNNETGDKDFDLHVWDPFKGVLPGFMRNEIHFISEQDPVSYNNARTTFGRNNVGKVWWDTSTLRYMWYEQGSNRERWLNWGRTFPGSTITVCEWVESKALPQNWSGDGTPRWVDQYVTERHWDDAEQKYVQYFYYWVQNRSKLDTRLQKMGRNLDVLTVARYIANPVGYGINLVNFVSNEAFVLSNVGTNLREDDSVIQINLSRNLNPDGIKHTAWKLMREGDNNSYVPEHLTDKLIDSLCGENAIGQVVPDPLLSEVEKYGIAFRPRQSMFKNVKEARRVLHSVVNELLADIKVSSTFVDWDAELPATLQYIERSTWYAVDRIDLSNNEKIRYNSSYKPVFNVASVSQLDISKNVPDGTVAQVNDTINQRHQLWMYVANNNAYKLIAIKNETVRLSDNIFIDETTATMSNELRLILRILVDKLFADNENWNKVFFELLKYAYAEQRQLSWAFKTSYIYVEKDEEDLIKFTGFKPDNFSKVIDYMNEVKPYTAKIREYKDGKRTPIEYIGQNGLTDFDKPPYADSSSRTIRILDDFDADDATIMANDPRYTDYYSITNKSTTPFRNTSTTIVFDRTNWQMTQLGFNANTTTYNQSIAWNMANINAMTSAEVSSNVTMRAIDRLFKFDSEVVTAFSNEVNSYYGNTSASSDANIVANSTAIYNMLEASALNTTLGLLKEKVGGGFRGETLDANVFTKFVQGFDGTTDYLTNFGYDTDPWDTVGWDQNIEVVNYEGIFSESSQGNITLRRNNNTYEGFDGATFKRILYGDERPEELALLDPLETLIMRVTTVIYPLGNSNATIAATPINNTASNVEYIVHHNLFGSTEYLRINDNTRTTLAANVYSFSTEIVVSNADVLPNPRPGSPGIIWVGSERILYDRKVGNTLSLLTRGSAGTTAQDWLITDVAGNSVTVDVISGATTESFNHLNPSANVWLEIGSSYYTYQAYTTSNVVYGNISVNPNTLSIVTTANAIALLNVGDKVAISANGNLLTANGTTFSTYYTSNVTFFYIKDIDAGNSTVVVEDDTFMQVDLWDYEPWDSVKFDEDFPELVNGNTTVALEIPTYVIGSNTALSLTDVANADYANTESLMKFIHNI